MKFLSWGVGGGRVGTTHHAGQPIPSPANQTAAGLIPRCKHLYISISIYLPPQLLADRKLYSVLRYRVILMLVYKRESVTRSLALFCPDSNPSGRVFNPIKVCLKYNLSANYALALSQIRLKLDS